jgi:tetratricopeptide (TPR) repeat protein
MQPARADTVLGDFDGAVLARGGETWRFHREGDRFVATGPGPDGVVHPYPVAYTFGVAPLQQYLVAFPGGRLQGLPAAWDTGARRWFHVSRNPDVPASDWLHWTRGGQSWNAMCADCHSTAVRKRYDPETDRYDTSWAELSVGCEACHGPGSRHLAWADRPPMARTPAADLGLVTRTSGVSSREHLALCAPCHSRRAQFADQGAPGGELLDRYLPSLLAPEVFHADGQIQDEDFELQAFVQSKMHASGVRCGDCHDAHSGRRHAEGNALCTRCHAADVYDAPAHHFHRPEWRGKPSDGARCVSCHMPGRTYMGVHLRRDHSLRVPRPYLSRAAGAPDACSASGCHADRSPAWVAGAYDRWYGVKRRPHYGAVLAEGRRGAPGSPPALQRLARDLLRPALVRATALDLLGGEPGGEVARTFERALTDPDPLVRVTAAARLEADPPGLGRALGPLLRDPVRAVRAEAAARLAGAPAALLPEAQRMAHAAALEEYVAAQRYMSDLPSGPFNLGNLRLAEGRVGEAEREYRRALRIDDRFHPAQVNLALLLAGDGREAEAEALLRSVHAANPRDASVALDLGLLLAGRGRRAEAEAALRAALDADPRLAPAAFNLAVLLGPSRAREAVRYARLAAELRTDEAAYVDARRYFEARARGAP